MKKSILSAIAAFSAVGILSAGVGAASNPTYDNTLEKTYTLVDGNNAADIYRPVAENGTTYHNAMVMKKVLVIEDTSNIPDCAFTFTASVPDVLSGDPIGRCVLPTNTTLAVYSGLNADKIKWGYAETNAAGDGFSGNIVNLTASGNSATLSYVSQDVDLTSTAAPSDNVIINNDDSATDTADVYYAIKGVQLDFSDCGFTEPGVYRYYIKETDGSTNSGITNDVKYISNAYSEIGTTDETKGYRTVDVYVEDCYPTDSTQHKIGISGYVMYEGKIEDEGPANTVLDSVTLSTNEPLEDGIANDDLYGNTQRSYGTTANQAEVSGKNKSEGFKNVLDTNKLTFKKKVLGNQGSKNKYFKFILKLTGEGGVADTINDADIFKISTDAAETSYDKTAYPNTATIYTNTDLASNNVTTDSLTGAQLKAGYTFYLHDNQQITITGIPSGLGYVITEYNEDYMPAIVNGVTGVTALDILNGDATGSEIEIDKNAANGNVTANNYAVITDTALISDAVETFNNERKGAIPTGIVLSVAAPVGIGAAAATGIIYLAVKGRKKKYEE